MGFAGSFLSFFGVCFFLQIVTCFGGNQAGSRNLGQLGMSDLIRSK